MASVRFPPEAILLEWPKPNYVNPVTQKNLLLGFEIPLLFITIVVVVLRVISRSIYSRLALDDLLMFGAAILAVALMVVTCLSVKHGFGQHMWDVQLSELEPAQKLGMATELLFLCCIGLTKSSIFTFYIRIFHSTYVKKLSYVGIAYTVVWNIASVLACIFQCTPVQAYWSLAAGGKCINIYAALMAFSICNSLSDIFTFVVPIKSVWELQLPRKQRIGLLVAFTLGLIVCVAGFIRVHYIKLAFHDSYDLTWNGIPLYISTAVELDLGILCASIPALKPLFMHMMPGMLNTTHNSKPSGYNNSSQASNGTMSKRIKSQSVKLSDDESSCDVELGNRDAPKRKGKVMVTTTITVAGVEKQRMDIPETP